MNHLISYLKHRLPSIILGGVCVFIFVLIFSLYDLQKEAVYYSALLCAVLGMVVGIADFLSYHKKSLQLEAMKNRISLELVGLPQAQLPYEKEYQELLKILFAAKTDLQYHADLARSELLDYYTLWAHQIKTPIAAMRLLLQTGGEGGEELLEQLFKIEQYVDMVLTYLRMESMSADLVLCVCDLDGIVKKAVRKYAKLFIRKKIILHYDALNCEVLTDKKWLLFVVEQLLSNALKYTGTGSISIYMDEKIPKTLIIQDSGIGIQEEDLPRVFERGFTGYNGRVNQKSTGVGLYLCKKILVKLSHGISISSSHRSGTVVRLDLSNVEMFQGD